MAKATRDAPCARKVSPVHALLDHLREPAWRELLLADDNEFGEAYMQWKSRMVIAKDKNRPGDILVLADETPTHALWLESKSDAGDCLMKLGQFGFALEQFEAALAIDPGHKHAREKKAVCLGRLGRYPEAREWVRRLTDDYPADAAVWARAGRVEKDHWVSRWRVDGLAPAQMREAVAAETASLQQAIEPYRGGFTADPSDHHAGINALTLLLLLRHLGGEVEAAAIDELAGGVASRLCALAGQGGR